MRKQYINGAFIVIGASLLSGCISTLDGQQLSAVAYEGEFYVEHQPKDSRELHKNISDILRKRGLNSTYGDQAEAPDGADYIVNYIDRWQWDMRMYLSNLRIEVRDRDNSVLVGYGESGQTSLASMGKTFEDVINRALDQMLSDSPPIEQLE